MVLLFSDCVCSVPTTTTTGRENDEPEQIFRLLKKTSDERGRVFFPSLVHISGEITWRISLMTAMGSIRYVPEPFGKADRL